MNLYLGCASLFALFVLLGACCYWRGVADGYEKGFRKGDTWWTGIEAEVNATRRQIWREEAGKQS